MIDKLKRFVRHNIGSFTGVVICVMAVALFGCLEVTTKSVVDPNRNVTKAELDAEVDSLANQITLAYDDIAKKEEVRAKLVNIGVSVVTGEDFNPIGIGLSLLSILGLGAVVDNRLKDRVIKTKDNNLDKLTKKIKGTK